MLGMFRDDDSDTSKDAAESASMTRTQMKAVVARLLREYGDMTDQELLFLMRDLGMTVAYSSPGKRRGDLAADGLVIDSGVRRVNSNGRNMIVWHLLGEGEPALAVTA